jgi:hypothetical protein
MWVSISSNRALLFGFHRDSQTTTMPLMLSPIDYGIIGCYFVLTISLAFILRGAGVDLRSSSWPAEAVRFQ